MRDGERQRHSAYRGRSFLKPNIEFGLCLNRCQPQTSLGEWSCGDNPKLIEALRNDAMGISPEP